MPNEPHVPFETWAAQSSEERVQSWGGLSPNQQLGLIYRAFEQLAVDDPLVATARIVQESHSVDHGGQQVPAPPITKSASGRVAMRRFDNLSYNTGSEARGLGQVTPIAFKQVQNLVPSLREVAHEDLDDPLIALTFAGAYDRYLQSQYGGEYNLMDRVGMYHAGPSNYKRNRNIGATNREYVKRIFTETTPVVAQLLGGAFPGFSTRQMAVSELGADYYQETLDEMYRINTNLDSFNDGVVPIEEPRQAADLSALFSTGDTPEQQLLRAADPSGAAVTESLINVIDSHLD